MTAQSIKLTDMALSNHLTFADEVAPLAGSATVLPNVAVYNAASRAGRRGGDITLHVEADNPGVWTVYRVRKNDRHAACLLIDAETNQTIDLREVAMDEDEAAEFVAANPSLARLIADLDY